MAPGVEEDHSADDAEIAELRARLGRAVAVRRELQRKLATLRKSERLWDEHRAAVEQLSASRHADAMTRMLNDANRIRQMAGGTDLPLSGQPQPPPSPAQRVVPGAWHLWSSICPVSVQFPVTLDKTVCR